MPTERLPTAATELSGGAAVPSDRGPDDERFAQRRVPRGRLFVTWVAMAAPVLVCLPRCSTYPRRETSRGLPA